MSEKDRLAIVVAGPNGAGKTTFVESFLKRYIDCDEFLNADLIAAGLSPFAPERHNLQASEIFLRRLTQLESGDQSFAVETTLAGRTYAPRIRHWRSAGFRVILFFLWLPDAETAIKRVAERVAHGGHNIPTADIRRRFERGLRNLTLTYVKVADETHVLDARTPSYRRIYSTTQNDETIHDADIWRLITGDNNDGCT